MSKKLSRKGRVAQRNRTSRNRNIFTWGGVLIFVGILAYATWDYAGNAHSLPAVEVADPWKGAADGVIEIVEYGDFGCHACQAWHNAGIRERILAQYGEKVRFVWRDFPIITAQSPRAAEAGHCASAQGKFWEFHDHVYENLIGLDRERLENYASAVGLDVGSFGRCLDERVMVRKVQANEQHARRLGIRGTPGFTVNGQVLPGPPSFDYLSSLIERTLAAAD